MPTLAPKLPWQHAFAGGYPRRGGQALPTDPDAIDYLNRVKAADGGASVEVGIAQAIEAFIVGCKADSAGYAGDPTRSNWDAIQASCVMCGARTLSGALVPLKTPYGPELWDGTATPTILNSDGSAATWDAGTQTMTITSPTATSTSYPRFLFSIPGMLSTKQYVLSGRFSGSISQVTNVRLGGVINGTYNTSTGEFYARAYPSTTNIEFDLNGTQTGSLTIESLSIREDSFTPTALGSWASGDYSRSGATPGLKGNGSTKYLDTNRANNADGQNDQHMSFYASVKEASNKTTMGAYSIPTASGTHISDGSGSIVTRSQSVNQTATTATVTGFIGVSRSDAAAYTARSAGTDTPVLVPSAATSSLTLPAFAFNYSGTISSFSSARLAFYSVGSAVDLSAMDERVTNLVTAIRFHTLTGLLPNDYDPDTIAYIVAAYEAGGLL